jgi:hypothetical protein
MLTYPVTTENDMPTVWIHEFGKPIAVYRHPDGDMALKIRSQAKAEKWRNFDKAPRIGAETFRPVVDLDKAFEDFMAEDPPAPAPKPKFKKKG